MMQVWISSNGRVGSNIVTTAGADAAHNIGLDDVPDHKLRYEKAGEFVEVATEPWDSWADDAVVADKESGVHTDSDRGRAIDHEGRFFEVAGPLNLPLSAQGYPVPAQAGSSEDGREVAARHAEAVCTAQQTIEDGLEFYTDLKGRAVTLSRAPETIKILPGIVPVIGDTEAHVRELDAELERLISPEVPSGSWRASGAFRWRIWIWTANCPRICPPRTTSRARRATSPSL